jgi:2,3-bisphosphoglycerate-dependent phosphoglycerate mutase
MTALAMRIVLLRHGRSEWNRSGRFTGWADIALSDAGLTDAARAGQHLAAAGLAFDEIHVSLLRRTHQTAHAVLAAMTHAAVQAHADWRLNERHYGQLQGMDHHEIAARWGEENFRRWRRGYLHAPPKLDLDDPRHPRFNALFAELEAARIPFSESLSDCQRRLLPWWEQTALPRLRRGRRLLVVSHGNTLRSLVMHLEQIAPDAIEHVEIPSGVPLAYTIADDPQGGTLHVTGKEWLGNAPG